MLEGQRQALHMAKDTNGDEVEVLVPGGKAGDKLTCTQTRDRMICQKDPGKPQKETMKTK